MASKAGSDRITGRHCVEALLRAGNASEGSGWRVITLARRDLEGLRAQEAAAVQQVKADLLDAKSVETALCGALDVAGEGEGSSGGGGGRGITHIFHCAYLMRQDAKEECEVNLRMLRNVVEAAEAANKAGTGSRSGRGSEGDSPAPLQHVFCMEGGKWYGQALHTPLSTPHREDHPHILGPMFYFDLQGYLERCVAEGAPRTWSALRPNPVCGFSTGSFMNITTSIAVYACICKELGVPLRFPGTAAAYTIYQSLCDVTDAGLLAEAMLHCATTPACANRAFNIANGDVFRWQDMWPKIAACFGMEVGPPVCTPLVKAMADKGEVWDTNVKKHSLQSTPFEQLVTWPFADFVLTFPGDWFSTVNALRRTGFHPMCIDSDEMFARLFQRMRDQQVIPPSS